MHSNLKYILLGLIAVGGMTALMLFSAYPQSRSAQERTVDTPTLTPLPSITPLPAPTSFATSTPVTPTPLPDSILVDQITAILPDYGGDWNILIRADGQRDMVDINADRNNHAASIIKVPIAMLFFKTLEERGIPPTEYNEFLSTYGIGQTYMQLLTAMLVESEEDATDTLKEVIYDSKIDVNGLLAEWGAPDTDLKNRHSTSRDIAALYETLYFGHVITPEGRAILLDLLATYTSNDDTRLGVIRPSLPGGAEFYNKRGSVVTPQLIIGDSALVAWDANGTRHTYVLVILSYYSNEYPTTDVRLVKGIEAIARIFWDFVKPP